VQRAVFLAVAGVLALVVSSSPLASASSSVDVWSMHGPANATVTAIAVAPSDANVVYAGVVGGVFRSDDGGTTWTRTAPSMPTPSGTIIALAVDPANPLNVIATNSSCRLLYSSDGGATWQTASTGIPQPPFCYNGFPVRWLAGTVYTVISGGFYASTDGGASWTLRGSPPESSTGAAGLAVVAGSPETVWVGTNQSTVAVSADGGETWTDRSTGLPSHIGGAVLRTLIADPNVSTTAYALIPTKGMYKYTAGGPWKKMAGSSNTTALIASPTSPTTLYSGAEGKIYRSTNAGLTWLAANPGHYAAYYSDFALGVAPSAPTHVFAGGQGLYRSTDSGASFAFIPNGIEGGITYSIAVDPSDPQSFMVGTDAAGVFGTHDGGDTWTALNTGMSNQIFEMVVDPRDDGTYFAANGTDVLRTTDSGAHWAPSDTGLPSSDCQSVAIDPASPDTVYAACGAQMSQSTDGGDSWSPFGPNLGPGGLRHVTVSPTDGGVIFADTSNTLWRTGDGGVTWTSYSSYTHDVDFAPDGTAYTAGGSTVMRFAPGSATPENVSTGLAGTLIESIAVDPEHPSTLYAGADTGTYQSVDSGGHWSKLTMDGLTSPFAEAIVVQGSHLIVATGHGIATIDLAGPSAATGAADPASGTTVGVHGTGNPNGGAATAFFEYGATTAYGSQTTATSIGSGTSDVPVSANLSGLTRGATYHYRVVVTNGGGIAVGDDATFTVPALGPTATTSAATGVAMTSAVLNGSVTPGGAATTYHFEWGLDTSYGNATPDGSAGSGTSPVSKSAGINSLSPGTTYHYRIVASSSAGTATGVDRTFSTANVPPSITSIAQPVIQLGALSSGKVPLAFSWTAAQGTAPICGYKVSRSTTQAPGSFVFASPTDTSVTDLEAPTSRLTYEVMAVDCSGLASQFSPGPQVAVQLLQEAATALHYTGTWKVVAAKDASGGHVKRSVKAGSKMTYSFTGRSIGIVTEKGTTYGGLRVSVDGGTPVTLNLHATARNAVAIPWTISFPTRGAHTVSFTVVKVSGKVQADIDAIAVVS
jgi:photosystem II stability/assembly factor-like uncharacterized protein